MGKAWLAVLIGHKNFLGICSRMRELALKDVGGVGTKKPEEFLSHKSVYFLLFSPGKVSRAQYRSKSGLFHSFLMLRSVDLYSSLQKEIS